MVPGRADDGLPGQDPGDRPDQVLWVTGFPLSRPDGDEHLSLVVFLEVRSGGSGAAHDQLHALRERAVVAPDIPLTIPDPSATGNPLVWAHPYFPRPTRPRI